LIDMGSLSLASSPDAVCLRSISCTSVGTLAPRFLRTPPRDDALALRYYLTSIRLQRRLSPPSRRTCSAHHKKRASREARPFDVNSRLRKCTSSRTGCCAGS
jgi:hypothetical protein